MMAASCVRFDIAHICRLIIRTCRTWFVYHFSSHVRSFYKISPNNAREKRDFVCVKTSRIDKFSISSVFFTLNLNHILFNYITDNCTKTRMRDKRIVEVVVSMIVHGVWKWEMIRALRDIVMCGRLLFGRENRPEISRGRFLSRVRFEKEKERGRSYLDSERKLEDSEWMSMLSTRGEEWDKNEKGEYELREKIREIMQEKETEKKERK